MTYSHINIPMVAIAADMPVGGQYLGVLQEMSDDVFNNSEAFDQALGCLRELDSILTLLDEDVDIVVDALLGHLSDDHTVEGNVWRTWLAQHDGIASMRAVVHDAVIAHGIQPSQRLTNVIHRMRDLFTQERDTCPWCSRICSRTTCGITGPRGVQSCTRPSNIDSVWHSSPAKLQALSTMDLLVLTYVKCILNMLLMCC